MPSLFAVLALATALVSASGGRVVDARTGRPIAGAEVTVVGARESARTNADGRFTWPDVPPPPIVIVVILPDGRVAKPIRVATVDSLDDLRLAVDVGLSEAVTVTGVAPDIDVAAGATGTSITAADVALRRPMTMTQTLENIPGIGAISEGQSATPAIRGLARGRTLILVDGGRVSTERGAGPNASFLDPGTLARVDVARGPGSVAYGTDAFGGVIAARTRWPDFGGAFGARLVASAGAGLPERRADLELSRGYGRGGVLAAARLREFDDYESPNGVVPYSSWRDAGVRLLWAHMAGDTRWSFGWQSDVARDIGRPRSDSNAIVATSPFERSHRLTISAARGSAGRWRDVRIDAFVGASEQRTEQDRLPAPGRPKRVDRADGDARDLQVRLTGRRAVGWLRLHAGADFHGRFAVSATDTAFMFNAAGAPTSTVVTTSMESARRTALGLFAEGDVQVNRWMRLSGGVRGDGTRSVNDGGFYGDRSIGHQALAGVAAVTVTPGRDLSLTAQVARGFREPTLTDRFSRGPVGRGFIEGNPDLVPETSRQFDATIRYGGGRYQVSGAIYRYDISQLIERYSAGVDLFRMRNRGRARLDGAELDVRLGAGRGLTIDLVAQASRGRDAIDGTALDDIAPRSGSVIARHVWRARLWSYLRVASIAAPTKAGPSEVPTPGYVLLDAAASWRVNAVLEVRATLRNATDASFYSSAGPRWVWAPGRQASVTFVIAVPR